MLITLRMRFAGLTLPTRRCGTRLQKAAMLSSTAWTSGTTFFAIDHDGGILGSAQRYVQDCPALRDIDLVAAEHGVRSATEDRTPAPV